MRKIFTTKAEPVIYFRMWKGIIMYIGETSDLKRGRPFRKGDADCEQSKSETEINTVLDKIEKRRFKHKHLKDLNKSQKIRDNRYIGEYDKIITIKASKNSKRRQYWEAYFIVKYKPVCMSHISRYIKMLKGKNYKVSEQKKEEILKVQKAGLDAFSRKNQKSIIKKLMFQQLTGIQMYTDARKCLESVKQNEI